MSKAKQKLFITLLSIVMALVIFIVGVIGGILILINSDKYFENQFTKNNVVENTGIQMDELLKINSQVRAFLLGGRDDLIVYSVQNGDQEQILVFKEDEQSHMLDVKNLLADFLIVNYVCMVILIGVIFLGIYKANYIALKSLNLGSIFALVIPVIFVLFFDTMFVIFHEIFFPQGNWMFNMRTSLMVNFYTEPFFLNFCINLGVILLSLCLVLFLVSKRKLKQKR